MLKKITALFLLIIACLSITLFSLTLLAPQPAKPANFEIVAHRGVHQDYEGSTKGVRVGKAYLNECTATRIHKPTHEYLENTLESIQAAFDFGATMVEIDIQPTGDSQLVVFHDWMLECRTNGKGKVSDHTVDYLKTLDIGYGYTHDGKTYPFRGKGVGKIQTLAEVLQSFPRRKFLIDNKNGNNMRTAQLLVEALSQLPVDQQKLIYLWCADKAFEHIKAKLPSAKRLLLPRRQHKEILIPYLYKFGFGEFPRQYKNKGIGLPFKYIWLAWGWPNRFLNKVYEADMRFYVYVNSIEQAQELSGVPLNGVITDRIELIGPQLKRKRNPPNIP
jgi:glycerophosphoryl diester phosphodiesterase